MYHILRRNDGAVKSFGPGDGRDWDDPDAVVEVYDEKLTPAREAALFAEMQGDPMTPQQELREQQKAADVAAVKARAAVDDDFAALARLAGVDVGEK